MLVDELSVDIAEEDGLYRASEMANFHVSLESHNFRR